METLRTTSHLEREMRANRRRPKSAVVFYMTQGCEAVVHQSTIRRAAEGEGALRGSRQWDLERAFGAPSISRMRDTLPAHSSVASRLISGDRR